MTNSCFSNRCNFTDDGVCLRCGNLLVNPSFEAGLTGWNINSIQLDGQGPLEGTVNALMNADSSMFQDVQFERECKRPLLLSFQIYPRPIEQQEPLVGNLVVEVLWLNGYGEIIGTGLRSLIPESTTSNANNILTFVEVTDTPPSSAEKARLQFSLGSSELNKNNLLIIDNIIFAPIDSANLVKNSGFQLGLTGWESDLVQSNSLDPIYEGTGRAKILPSGTLFQNVPISKFQRNSSFLLSFAVTLTSDVGGLRIEVLWLNFSGNFIGTGLNLFINGEGINQQGNYTTYVDVTTPAPNNAVAAQIRFTSTNLQNIFIDKVIFDKVGSQNLLVNPSFENAVINPWVAEGYILFNRPEAYEGDHFVRLINFSDISTFIFQLVPVKPQKCYMLSFGLGSISAINEGNTLAEVYWLDLNGQEIGLGLSIIVLDSSTKVPGNWITYIGITEPAPPNAVQARVQFSNGNPAASIDIDKVVFARLE